jgi:hypothetical protein
MPSIAEQGTSASPGDQQSPDAKGAWAATERIVQSETFRRCPRLRDFLSFVVRCSIEDRVHEINEYSLGVQVFGKPSDYQPNQDNIVRATARQLRTKLAEYYAGEGALDEWLVEIPKGGYVPVWHHAAHEPVPQAAPAPVPTRRPNWITVALVIVTLCSLSLAAVLLIERNHVPASHSAGLLTGVLSDQRTPITLVLDDPYLPPMSNWSGKSISLKDYLEKQYLNDPAFKSSEGSFLRGMFQGAEITSTSTAQLLVKVALASLSNGQNLQVRHCRDLQVRDLSIGNFIFFGGVGSNPWVGLLQKTTNFPHFFEPGGLRGFQNRNPQQTEPARFAVADAGDSGKICFARFAILRNPMGEGLIALIGGTSRLSTEAAGDFALSPSGRAEVAKLCPGVTRDPSPEVELILETTSLNGSPASARVVAHRCGPFKAN